MEAPAGVRPGATVSGLCPLCGCMALIVMPFRYAFRGRHLVGVRCPSCALVFVHPQPTPEEIRELYAENYFTECSDTCGAHGPGAYMELAAESVKERKGAARRLDRLFRRHVEQRGELLEIGCGPGFLLAELRELGWTVRGLEISQYAADHAREKLNLAVSVGPIEGSTYPQEVFDLVFMGDVLEHLSDPLSSLRVVRQWLKPMGVLVVAVPSTLNLLSASLGTHAYRLMGRFKTLRIAPYHLFEYRPRTLRQMLQTAGLTVLALRQSAVPLRKMGLRGTLIENAGKVLLQVLAHGTAPMFNTGGDRLLAVTRRAP